MTIVVDASLVAAWLLPDEGDTTIDEIIAKLRGSYGLAPSIFRHEIRNILLSSERRGRITAAIGDALLVRSADLPIRDCGPCEDGRVIDIARTTGLTGYDAAYVALALETRSSLATLDKAMAAAARVCGLTILGPLTP